MVHKVALSCDDATWRALRAKAAGSGESVGGMLLRLGVEVLGLDDAAAPTVEPTAREMLDVVRAYLGGAWWTVRDVVGLAAADHYVQRLVNRALDESVDAEINTRRLGRLLTRFAQDGAIESRHNGHTKVREYRLPS